MSSHYDYHDSDYHNHTMIIMTVTVIVCNSTLGRPRQLRSLWILSKLTLTLLFLHHSFVFGFRSHNYNLKDGLLFLNCCKRMENLNNLKLPFSWFFFSRNGGLYYNLLLHVFNLYYGTLTYLNSYTLL